MIWLLIAIFMLLFILFVPASASLVFDDKLKLTVRVLFLKFNIPLGGKKKKQKKADKKDGKKDETKEEKSEKDSLLSKLDFVKKIIKSISRCIPHVLTVTRFRLNITVGNEDPCDAALTFGAVNAAVFPLVSLIDSYLKVKKSDVNVTVDYDKTDIFAQFELTVRTFLLKLIICAIIILIDIA